MAGARLARAGGPFWLSINGADPVFVYSVNKQNPAAAPRGIGFRTFSADIEEMFVNNVLLMPGAAAIVRPSQRAVLLGNTNCDDIVDVETDFETIRLNFQRSPRTRTQGDLSGDGLVAFDDFIEWKGAFLAGGGSLAGLNFNFGSSPEPSSFGLELIALVLAGRLHIRESCIDFNER